MNDRNNAIHIDISNQIVAMYNCRKSVVRIVNSRDRDKIDIVQ